MPTFKEFSQIIITFSLTVIAWIFFRAEDIGHAFSYISEIFSKSLFSLPGYKKPIVIFFILIFIIIEWVGREQEYGLEKLGLNWNRYLRWFFYYVLAMLVILFVGQKQEFIYFQF